MTEKIACPACGKAFSTQEALDQHSAAKHAGEKEKKKLPVAGKHVLAGVAVIAVAAGLYALFSSSPYVPLTADGEHVLGAANASVLVIEYSDFQCPACGKFFRETEPQMISDYVETGKIRFAYRHFPLPNHQYAQKAAEASECAADQGKFWEYHDTLFKNQQVLTMPALKNYASDTGIDRKRFDACLDSGAMAARVRNDLSAAAEKSVRSTPTFITNGRKVEGAQPFSSFKQVIDAELGR